MLTTILVIFLILALVGSLPSWPHGGFGMGYAPFGGILGLLLIIVLIYFLLGHRI